MRTIPHRYNGSPRGDYRRTCDICAFMYHRNDLVKKRDGLFYCPKCEPEVDRVTLALLQEQNSANDDVCTPRIEEE